MANDGAHVPKFGNWESENVAYSACFERAHREKSGTTSFRTSTNPNDPEALNLYNIGGGDDGSNSRIDVTFEEGVSKGSSSSSNSHGRNLVKQRSLTMTTRASECVNDVTVLNRREKKGVTKGPSNSVGGHEARRSLGIGTHVSHHFSNQKVTSVPKFGEWDEKDPKSGESFTVIFSKVKQEKQIDSALPNKPSRLNNCSNMQNQYDAPSPTLSKYWCCFVPSESK